MRRPSTPADSISIPALARACGYSGTYLYRLIARGDGPAVRPHGRQAVIRLDAAITWVETHLRGLLRPTRRRRMEDCLKDLRVQRDFARAQARQRSYRYARSRYGAQRAQEAA